MRSRQPVQNLLPQSRAANAGDNSIARGVEHVLERDVQHLDAQPGVDMITRYGTARRSVLGRSRGSNVRPLRPGPFTARREDSPERRSGIRFLGGMPRHRAQSLGMGTAVLALPYGPQQMRCFSRTACTRRPQAQRPSNLGPREAVEVDRIGARGNPPQVASSGGVDGEAKASFGNCPAAAYGPEMVIIALGVWRLPCDPAARLTARCRRDRNVGGERL